MKLAHKLAALAGAAAALALAPLPALAQALPPSVKIIIPFAAGGATDILARTVGAGLSKSMGVPVEFENKPGAGGNIGAALAAKAPADGSVLFMGTIGTHAINKSLYTKLPYDPVKDFAPLTRVAMVPNVVVVNPRVPARDVRELIAYARDNPNKISFGSSGSGSSTHLSCELFNYMANVKILHVPYKGSGPAAKDLAAGQIGLMCDNLPAAMPNIKAGLARPLAVTSAKRSPSLPDVPTVAESGLPGYEATSWFALYAPGATPAPLAERLSAEVGRVLRDPAVRKALAEQGAEPHPERPAELAAFQRAETLKWAPIVKASGATVD